MSRFITVWRKTGDKFLDWDFHISEFADEVPRVVENLRRQGVKQFSTYRLGEQITEHSDEFAQAKAKLDAQGGAGDG